MGEEQRFVHLHVHTSYSFLDGMCKPDELVKRAEELGFTSLAITDHNHIGGTFEFQKQCLEHNIKPILGCEMYWTEDTDILSLPPEKRLIISARAAYKNKAITKDQYIHIRISDVPERFKKKFKALLDDPKKKYTKKELHAAVEGYLYDTKQYHIIFLAMNQTGWKNLIKLQSEAARKCTYNGRFVCDNKLLKKYNEGLLMTTACIANRIPRYIEQNNMAAAERLLDEWHEIFGDRMYLEVQPLALPIQAATNKFYIEQSQKKHIKLVATNDVHYVLRSDHDDHDTLLCIGTGKLKTDADRLRYTNDYWLRTREEMEEAFTFQYKRFKEYLPSDYLTYIATALDNTCEVAKRVTRDIQMKSPVPLIPQVKLPKGWSAADYLNVVCNRRLISLAERDEYVKEHFDEYLKRLSDELEVIIPKGFDSYLLVVNEYVSWADSNGVGTDFGRGSAAGSLCLYLLGITKEVDPIKEKLLFSRFLTKDRTALPDIDCDFDWNGRDRVIQHLEDIYGNEKVCHVGVYSELGVKSGLKDVGRALNIPFDTMNQLSKQIDEINIKPQPDFKDYDELKNSESQSERNDWEKFHKLEIENKELFRLARKFEHLKRNFGVHASAILAMPKPITDMVSVRYVDGIAVTLYTGPEVEELNLVKLDILSLKNISMVMECLRHIHYPGTLLDFYRNTPRDDQNIFKMLSDKRSEAVFQFESDLFKGIESDVQPQSIDDLAAITEIARPGPLSAGFDKAYARRKRGEEKAEPVLRGMEHVVGNTQNLMLTQEQLMRISVDAMGFDLNQSDSIVRKIVGKKQVEKLEMLRRMMKYGKINREGPDEWENNPNAPWYDHKMKYGAPIDGGLKRGYTEQEMDDFWNIVKGCGSYLFNHSHGVAYSYLSYYTAYLKYYHPTEYMAAVLSMQSDDEKIQKYIKVAESEGIQVKVPDINLSEASFTPIVVNDNKAILYGLASIKGVGAASIDPIISARPFTSLEDLMARVPKKYLNKRVINALAMSGALDCFNTDRIQLLKDIKALRKDKDSVKLTYIRGKDKLEKLLEYEDWTEDICILMEEATVSTAITYKRWINTIPVEGKVSKVPAHILSYREHMDKNGNMMCFCKLLMHDCEADVTIFSSLYSKHSDLFDPNLNPARDLLFSGKKQGDAKFLASQLYSVPTESERVEVPF